MTDTATDLIVAALQSNDSVEAERLCRVSLQQQPDESGLRVLLALSLWRQGRHDAALGIYADLAHANPDSSLHWGNYATALQTAGDLVAAEDALKALIRLAPDDPDRLDELGIVQLRLGKPREARDTLLRAFGKAPDSPGIRIHAASVCSACRDSRADHLLEPWREWLPLDDALQFDLAELLTQIGEVASALTLFEELLARNPSHREAQLLCASLYERVNRLDDAEALVQKIAASGAQADEDVRREIAHQRAELASRRHQYALARTILEQAGPRNDKDIAHWFALARSCDKLGDTNAAMRALETGHALQIEEMKIAVPHFFEPDAEILPNAETRIGVDEYRRWPELRAPGASQSPVFVVGFPRSGTTLLEQMLDAHPRLQSMDERPFFNMLAMQLENSTGLEIPRDLGRLGQRDCDELRKGYLILACGKVPRCWNARLVDKNPLNMLWLPMIHHMFPQAKFILALRHPCDVILSCYMQNFRAAVLAVAGQSLGHLARAYVAAMENWLYHVGVFGPDVFVSRYEDLVADTPGQARKIAAFLGLDDAESMLRFDVRAKEKGYIKTPSYTQVIEPINRKGVDRWQRYRAYLEPVLPILRPMLEHWHYAVKP